MTITLELWQIGVLTLLIPIQIVILSRMAILIALVLTPRLSRLIRSETNHSAQSRLLSNLNESPSKTLGDPTREPGVPHFTKLCYCGHSETQHTIEGRCFLCNKYCLQEDTTALGPEYQENVEYLGSTGYSPGGVSFDPEDSKFVKVKPAKRKRRWLR